MIRVGRTSLLVGTLLLLPMAASAQKDTRQTREAEKFIGLAMTRQDEAERTGMYQQAMTHLRQGMTEDAQNAKVWLLAGTALAALGELVEADQAFDRAVELHPDYAEDVKSERETAWVMAFNNGIQLMDAQDFDGALKAMEGAQLIYDERPEALMNLGALYANAGEPAKAVQALRDAITATSGPLFETLDDAGKAEWVSFRSMAKSNIGQIIAQQGIMDFQAERFDSAAARFMEAAEMNPHSRDYLFNYGQALWAQASPLEESLASASQADSARIISQLKQLYAGIQSTAVKTRELDPNNEVLYLMEARTHRIGGDFGDAAAKDAGQAAALKLLEQHAALTFFLDDIIVTSGEAGATIAGNLKNAKAAEGSPLTISFTLIDMDGKVLGTHDVVVNAPAAEQVTPFESQSTVTGDVAGWKYTVR